MYAAKRLRKDCYSFHTKPVACTRSQRLLQVQIGEGHDVHLHSPAQGRRRRESQERCVRCDAAPHGGGSFLGTDPSKSNPHDRSDIDEKRVAHVLPKNGISCRAECETTCSRSSLFANARLHIDALPFCPEGRRRLQDSIRSSFHMKPVACTRSHTPGLAGVGEGHDVHLHSPAQGRRRRESQEWVAPSVTAYNITRYKHLIVTCNAEKPVAWKLLFLSPFCPEPTPDQESRLLHSLCTKQSMPVR